jgi:hypothetical protein
LLEKAPQIQSERKRERDIDNFGLKQKMIKRSKKEPPPKEKKQLPKRKPPTTSIYKSDLINLPNYLHSFFFFTKFS